LRYDLERNIIPLCNGCHWRIHGSGDPSYQQRIIDIKGIEWYRELDSIRRTSIKVNKEYYEGVETRLSALLDEEILFKDY